MKYYRVVEEFFSCPCGSKHTGTICAGYPECECPFPRVHAHIWCHSAEEHKTIYPKDSEIWPELISSNWVAKEIK